MAEIADDVVSLRQDCDALRDELRVRDATVVRMEKTQQQLADSYATLRANQAAAARRAAAAEASLKEQMAKLMAEKEEVQSHLDAARVELERNRAQCAEEMKTLLTTRDVQAMDAALKQQLLDSQTVISAMRGERATLLEKAAKSERMTQSEASERSCVSQKDEIAKALAEEKKFWLDRIVGAHAKLEQTTDEIDRRGTRLRNAEAKTAELEAQLRLERRCFQLEQAKVQRLTDRLGETTKSIVAEQTQLVQFKDAANKQTLELSEELSDAWATVERQQRGEETLKVRISLLQKALEDLGGKQDVSKSVDSEPDKILEELVAAKIKLAEAYSEIVVVKGSLCKADSTCAESQSSRSSINDGAESPPLSGERRKSPTRVSRAFHIF